MGVNITYMGTKREMAPLVADVISVAADGPVLDAFSGMCSVGEAIGTRRHIWANDIQVFPWQVATAVLASRDEPPRPNWIADLLFDIFSKIVEPLRRSMQRSIAAEEELCCTADYIAFAKRRKRLATILTEDLGQPRIAKRNLFTCSFSNNYFGVAQSVEIDSIVRLVRRATARGLITVDQARWLQIGLGRAMLHVANSTGHFAQYLSPKPSTYKRFIRQRQRSVWEEWLGSVADMVSVGTASWRSNNRTFNEDSLTLLPRIRRLRNRPRVVYADPPYTDDQYSRYYHVLETLVLYDFPTTAGAGLYRPDRFQTPFSIKTKAALALDALARATAAMGSDLVLSYPTNGLIYEAGGDPLALLRQYFRSVEICHTRQHNHSTFGASKGPARAPVIEQIYLATA